MHKWWLALGLGTAAATMVAIRLSVHLPDSLHIHLALLLLAGALWLLSLWCIRGQDPRPRRSLMWLWVVALLLRLPGWLTAPRHSDDFYRYLWDGAVQSAGYNPYAGPPDAPIYAALHQGDIFQHINHRELPTVYPPAAQLAFRLAAAIGPPLLGWKLLVGAADLLVLLLLVLLCRRAGTDPRWAAAWGWSPLCAVELAQEAHMDVLGILPLCAALLLYRRRNVAAGLLSGVAMLVKPLGAALLPALILRRSGAGRVGLLPGARACLLGLLLSGACVLPYLGAGRAMAGSLGEYGRRWRGNDGAFALLQAGTRAAVEHIYHPPYHEPWRFPALARLITGRDRDTVWPDELASFLARMAAMAGVLLSLLAALYLGLSPARLALVVLGSYLLLTPTLHPWYVLWVLFLCPLWPQAALPWLVLAALVPLGYEQLGAYLRGQQWTEPVWTRLVEHGTCWAVLLMGVARVLKQRPPDPRPQTEIDAIV